MKRKIEKAAKAKARGVSMPPEVEREAIQRALDLDISFSKYVQRLIRLDLEKFLLKS